MLIRQEECGDYETVHDVVTAAFASAEHSDGGEAKLVSALRKSSAFVPELSLVAVCGGKIAGHILFTKVTVGEQTALALAPLSVLPSCQDQGIGQALIREGHRIARSLGYEYSIVLGHPHYYPKTGYRPAGLYGIRPPFQVPEENFMAVKLKPDAAPLDGIVQYDPAFGV
ncbi:MAG TPA: N-acetyltransferase [Candidatus Anaerobutyricum stercoripullorum]|uniref:N-acetyltransferase n=1 Tax=Candidatus Anaerobutyricum stercoripullorum TaxID=2838456 RepID=A0A9D2BCV4_9FIRM|nr:N-acetyltransferase [Candidatus Anaerobutyricum stercoripullorum]